MLVVVTSEKFYELIFLVGGVWILIEVAVGYIIARVVLERMIGKNMIFGGTGDMQHPVVWTWYSTYLLIVNIIKGLLAGIVRMILMIIMLVLQIGVMDRSNFPEGQESQDPAFVSFLSTLLFHHRYTGNTQFPLHMMTWLENQIFFIAGTGILYLQRLLISMRSMLKRKKLKALHLRTLRNQILH